jgi:hypothetical protein
MTPNRQVLVRKTFAFKFHRQSRKSCRLSASFCSRIALREIADGHTQLVDMERNCKAEQSSAEITHLPIVAQSAKSPFLKGSTDKTVNLGFSVSLVEWLKNGSRCIALCLLEAKCPLERETYWNVRHNRKAVNA